MLSPRGRIHSWSNRYIFHESPKFSPHHALTGSLISRRGLLTTGQFRTLDPSRLQPSDYLDLSYLEHAQVDYQNHDPDAPAVGSQLTYQQLTARSTGSTKVPFPQGTRGFLYHVGPVAHPAAGEVRFRVTPSAEPSTFAQGHDLRLDRGRGDFWRVCNPSTASRAAYSGLKQWLLDSGTVSPEGMERWAPLHFRRDTRILYRAGQPFFINFATAQTMAFYAARGEHLAPFRLRNVAMLQKLSLSRRNEETVDSPVLYHGSAYCAFEYCPTSIGGDPAFAIRVLKIVKRIRAVKPEHEHGVPPPKKGKLITLSNSPEARPQLVFPRTRPGLQWLIPQLKES